MTKLTLGSDRCRESLTYDVYGRATQLTWDRLKDGTRYTTLDFKRGYDDGSRVTYERRDYINASTNATLGGILDYGDRYYYDGANRLTKTLFGVGYVTSSHSAVETASESTTDFIYRRQFTLDEVGNRKTLAYDTAAQSGVRREDHVYDTQNQLGTRTVYDWNGSTLTQTSTEANTFDTNGNQKTAPTLKVDIENRLYEAYDASGHLWRYKYDPFGRRIDRKDTNGTFWTHTYYDGAQPIEEGVVQTGSSPLTESRVKFVRVYGPYLVDQILWARADLFDLGPNYYYEGFYQGDYLGSVQCLVSNAATPSPVIEGGVLETYRYSEYGQVQFCDGAGYYYSPNASLGEQDFTYTGREWNQELGLYYYRARWYRPETGGFLERDPILDASSVHGYGYVDTMVTSRIDPYGTQSMAAPFAIGEWMRRNMSFGSAINIAFPSPPAPPADPFAGIGPTEVKHHAEQILRRNVWPIGDPDWQDPNETANAMVHCIGMCLFKARWGEEAARAGGWLHEFEYSSTMFGDFYGDSMKDYANNKVGYECADMAKSPQDCYRCCSDKLDLGLLWLRWTFKIRVPDPKGGATPPRRGGCAAAFVDLVIWVGPKGSDPRKKGFEVTGGAELPVGETRESEWYKGGYAPQRPRLPRPR